MRICNRLIGEGIFPDRVRSTSGTGNFGVLAPAGSTARQRILLTIATLVLLSLASGSSAGRSDAETGRIRVLYVGDHGASSPSPFLNAEPMIQLRIAHAIFHLKGDARKKLNRVYFPRTYAELTDYDVSIVSDCPVDQFDNQHYFWFKDAVTSDGCGFVMIGGNCGFGGGPELPWTPTAVQDILPVGCLEAEKSLGRVEIIQPEHEFVASLPLEKKWEWMREYGINKVTRRQQAETIAEVISSTTGEPIPFWATWDVGEGRSFAVTGDWTPMGGVVFMRWGYYGDFAANLMMYASRNPLPADLEPLHRARARYLDFLSTRQYLFSVIEFAERFGANLNRVGEMMVEADAGYVESTRTYIDHNYEDALLVLEEAIGKLLEASELAMDLKDQAMFWIYVAEWSIVTATFSLGTFVVWTLMVRKRLYREVTQTRFTHEG
jgi:uncharacterized membrane protein